MSAAFSPAKNILLVDDDLNFPRVLSRALGRRGFHVEIAHDVDAALRLATLETGYAVVDLQLGTESGLSLIPKLRAINPEMCILLLTGYASATTVSDAIRAGANHCLTKPAETDVIVNALSCNQAK
jgi:two-component system, response regulator RegA